MKSVDQQIWEFIDDQKDYEIRTSRGMIISAPDECLLQAEFELINTEDASLSVCFRSDKKGFVNAFTIRKVQDIYFLMFGSLMEAFYEGLAEMICCVALEYRHYMTFQKYGPIIAGENDEGHKHIIPVRIKLETPNDFISYTKRYYKLMECNEN